MDALIRTHQPVPDFSLPDLEGKLHRLRDYRGRLAVVNFWSAECPHAARVDSELLAIMKTWGERVTLLPIAANVNEHEELLRETAAERGLPLVLLDRDQQVADRYRALTTPHCFVVDAQGILRYQGAFDNLSFRQRAATQFYLRQAVEAVLAGQPPDPEQTPPYGCAIVRSKPYD